MAVSIHKIKVGKGLPSVGSAVSYLIDEQAVGDGYAGYVAENGTAAWRWLATDRSRKLYALKPLPDRWTVSDLIAGKDPLTTEVIRRPGPDGTIVGGHDVTISPAPKSVSILWALGDHQLRRELESMVGKAANRAIGRLLAQVPLMRERFGPGPQGVRHVVVEDHIGVQVLHTTARVSKEGDGIADPQLHVHNVLIAMVDKYGKLRAIDDLKLRQHRSELDGEASAHLAEMLRQRGFEIERKLIRAPNGQVKRATWEVAGVPADLISAMSARTSEIEDLKAEYQRLYDKEAEGTAWDRWKAAQRGPKSLRTADELRLAWEATGQTHGFGPDEVAAATAAADARRESGVAERSEHSPEAEQFRQEILADLCRDHALVTERELDKLLMQRAVGLLDVSTAQGVVADMFGDGDVLQSVDDGRVTTLEVLAQEQRAIAAAKKLLEAEPGAAAAKEQLRAELDRLEEEGRPLDERQLQAVELALSGHHLVSITGPAGTGKGYASAVMTKAWQQQGRRVIALAVAGRTAQQAGSDSGADLHGPLDWLTTAIEHERFALRPSDVLLIDEAGMVDHHRYAAVLAAAAAAGTTVVQIGDAMQLSAVGPGGLWSVIHGMAESRGVAGELETIRRAKDPREAQAWTDFREGRVEEALTWIRDEGRLRLYETRDELLAGMVADWWVETGGAGMMMVDTSNKERDVINRLAQDRRLEAGQLGEESLRVATGHELRTGDRVLFTSIHKFAATAGQPAPKKIQNGTPGMVLGVDSATRSVTVEISEPVKGGGTAPRIVTVDATAPIQLGYARHVMKAQGMTVQTSELATSRATTHNELYVMLTRSQVTSRLHAVRADIEELTAQEPEIELAGRSARETPSALLLAQLRAASPDTRDAVARERGAMSWGELKSALKMRAENEAAEREATSRVEREPVSGQPAAERAATAGLPEGAIPVSEFNAQLNAAIAAREAKVEYATIERISAQAERSSTKLAIGERSWEPGPERQSQRQQARSAGVELRAADDRQHEVDTARHEERRWEAARPDVQRAAAREPARLAFRVEHAPERTRADRMVDRMSREGQAMPSRDLVENAGRNHAERGNNVEMLAHYQVVGRLDVTPSPERQAAQRWLRDPSAAIVVEDQGQEQRVRDAIAEQRGRESAAPAGEHQAHPEPRIVQAGAAYEERATRREAWHDQTQASRWHHVEPGAIDRAYVVMNDRFDPAAMSRALSVAAESHLVTTEPTWLEGELVRFQSERISEAMTERADAEQTRQAGEAARLASERPAERSAEREAQRTAEPSRAPEASRPEAERGGIER